MQKQQQEAINLLLHKNENTVCHCEKDNSCKEQDMNATAITSDESDAQNNDRKTIQSLGTQLSLIEQEYDTKASELSQLRSEIQELKKQRNIDNQNASQRIDRLTRVLKETEERLTCSEEKLHDTENLLESTQKRVDEYTSKESEWDILMTKRANEVQCLKVENFDLKKQLHSALPSIKQTLAPT